MATSSCYGVTRVPPYGSVRHACALSRLLGPGLASLFVFWPQGLGMTTPLSQWGNVCPSPHGLVTYSLACDSRACSLTPSRLVRGMTASQLFAWFGSCQPCGCGFLRSLVLAKRPDASNLMAASLPGGFLKQGRRREGVPPGPFFGHPWHIAP